MNLGSSYCENCQIRYSDSNKSWKCGKLIETNNNCYMCGQELDENYCCNNQHSLNKSCGIITREINDIKLHYKYPYKRNIHLTAIPL